MLSKVGITHGASRSQGRLVSFEREVESVRQESYSRELRVTTREGEKVQETDPRQELLRAVEELDLDYVRGVGTEAREVLLSGVPVGLDYCPGNGTRYELVLTPCGYIDTIDCRMPGSTYAVVAVPTGFGDDLGTAVLVSHLNGTHNKAWAVNLLNRGGDFLAPWYVEEKLGVSHDDAVALTALFAVIADDDRVLYGNEGKG